MDHAVALVQAYLQLNGYFTSAEYPIIAGAGRNGFRTITDIDILAFRFPSGEPMARGGKKVPKGLDLTAAFLNAHLRGDAAARDWFAEKGVAELAGVKLALETK